MTHTPELALDMAKRRRQNHPINRIGGGAVKFYAALCGTFFFPGIITDFFTKNPNSLPETLDARMFDTLGTDTGKCFSSNTEKKEAVFFDYPGSIYGFEMLKIPLPFLQSDLRTASMGLLPVFKSAACDPNNANVMTWEQAITKSIAIKNEFTQSPVFAEFIKSIPSVGIYRFEGIDSAGKIIPQPRFFGVPRPRDPN